MLFDIKAREHRLIVGVFTQLVRLFWHHRINKVRRFDIGVFVINPNLGDVIAQVVTHGTRDHARFLMHKARRGVFFVLLLDGLPNIEQVVQIVLQVFLGFANACSTDDDAHAFWQIKVAKHTLHVFAQLT